jgi:cyanophycinase
LVLSVAPGAFSKNGTPGGAVVAVGSGPVSQAIYKKALALSPNPKGARVVIFPQASGGRRVKRTAGQKDADDWLKAGAAHAIVINPLTRRKSLPELARADVIWFGGGAQLKLMSALQKKRLISAIRERHRAGAVVSGVSAGAAVMSGVMNSGKPSPKALRKGGMVAYQGLGITPHLIVDQHFVQLKRFGRLMTAVLDHPELVGIGVCERTAAIIQGSKVEVLGVGQVVVIDARNAKVHSAEKGQPQSANEVKIHILKQGQSWSSR